MPAQADLFPDAGPARRDSPVIEKQMSFLRKERIKMQIQRLVDLEDYEFDTLLVTYNHKNRLSIELGKVSEIFKGSPGR